MAVDEAIMRSVAAQASPPTLRLYGWQPLCLSLGYGQRAREADLDRIARFGWHIVRRPTGGRAILHGDELTYSVAMSLEHPLAVGDIVASYRRISEALFKALVTLGLVPSAKKQEHRVDHTGPVCFEVPSHYEMTVSGRKLVGSAQVRKRGALLQHGTLPLTGDLARICDALAYADEDTRDAAREQVHQRALTLQEALGQELDWGTVAEAIHGGFTSAFDLIFSESRLSPVEEAEALQLEREVYASDEWNFKR